ncbi:MAG: AAA family ATPase [Scrofimicrobium sp.]
MKGARPDVRLVAAEIMLVYYLFTSTVGAGRKREMINVTIGADNQELQIGEDGNVYRALSQHIGNPGSYYNTRQDIHVGYLIDLALQLKSKNLNERKTLLEDNPWGFLEFAEGIENQSATMRHVVCHLLYPQYFERIASDRHKNLILSVFGDLAYASDKGEEIGNDQRLYAIRERFKQLYPEWTEEQRDYYHGSLRAAWFPTSTSGMDEELDPMTALLFKKQIVMYGPPGTGKTYRAAQMAEALIRSEYIKRRGIKEYFEDLTIDEVVSQHVTRLQLHPSYGYQEFMVGLGLDSSGATSTQMGALPRLIERINDEFQKLGDKALPHVLILDEINRTDLSAMLGEAFSAIERDKRGKEIKLFPESESGQSLRFAVPQDLYIIGTMNEIDQSVEALDFALRRRFFWFPTPYSEDDLFEIWRAQWKEQAVPLDWDKAKPQLDELAENVRSLNERIRQTAELGHEYELGAALFADLPFFLSSEWHGKSAGKHSGRYLWNKKNEPLSPLVSLWTLSIEPVLNDYLAGSDNRDDSISELKQLFLQRNSQRDD